MTKKTSIPTDEAAAVEQFVQRALADGCNPTELSCALAAIALRMKLNLAPGAGSPAARRPAEIRKCVQRGDGVLQLKDKSERDRVSSNVAAEHQRSSMSRDVSALQADFRRSHSDTEFHALLIQKMSHQPCYETEARKQTGDADT